MTVKESEDLETKQLKRMRELVTILRKASKAYYAENREIMSNFDYDRLYEELEELERETGVILSGCIAGIAASLADAAVSDKYRGQIRTILALILIIVISQPFLRVDLDALVQQYIDDFENIHLFFIHFTDFNISNRIFRNKNRTVERCFQ